MGQVSILTASKHAVQAFVHTTRRQLIRHGLRVGAVLPGDFAIGKRKMKGVESRGMICSSEELALGDGDPGGIMLLPDGLEPGTPLTDVLPIASDVLELEITPNHRRGP